jgi:hypothetical protein
MAFNAHGQAYSDIEARVALLTRLRDTLRRGNPP